MSLDAVTALKSDRSIGVIGFRHLELVSAPPFKSGVVHLVDKPDPNPPTATYEDAKQALPQDGALPSRRAVRAGPSPR